MNWKIVEKFAHLLAGEVEKNGTLIGTLARKNEKLVRFCHVGT